jgi:hypothetical protein
VSHREVLSWRREGERAIGPNVAVNIGGLHASEPERPPEQEPMRSKRDLALPSALAGRRNWRFDARRGRGKPIIPSYFHAISCVPVLTRKRFRRQSRLDARGRAGYALTSAICGRLCNRPCALDRTQHSENAARQKADGPACRSTATGGQHDRQRGNPGDRAINL